MPAKAGIHPADFWILDPDRVRDDVQNKGPKRHLILFSY